MAADIEARLVIPPAETWVIGDPIPLHWRFRNEGSEPVGFMWEGCCRLNGRLDVTLDGRPVDPIPPGTALAHMFAKAERIDPGQAREFDTRLADWVALPQAGTYELRGRYTGVLPSQQPQVPKGLALWRDAAQTPPARVTVITPGQYLEQRATRETARGLALELSGPAKLPPLAPATLALRIANRSKEPRRLVWPQSLDLWILDASGRRVPNVSTEIEGDYEELTLAPGQALTRRITLTSDRLEGKPFGDHRVFVDLRAGDAGRPRVPSTPMPLRWELGMPEVAALLAGAAEGPSTGFRNPALKLLRVHLADIADALASVDTAALPDKARALRSELSLAACLKEFAPEPGMVPIPVTVHGDGLWQLADAQLARCAGARTGDPASALAAILGVRRHLGWQPTLELRVEDGVTMPAVFNATQALAGFQGDLGAPPHLVLQHPEAQLASRITPRPDDDQAAAISVLRTSDGLRFRLPARDVILAPRMLGSVEDLDAEIERQPADYRRPLVRVDRDLTWGELKAVLAPLARRGAPVDLVLAE